MKREIRNCESERRASEREAVRKITQTEFDTCTPYLQILLINSEITDKIKSIDGVKTQNRSTLSKKPKIATKASPSKLPQENVVKLRFRTGCDKISDRKVGERSSDEKSRKSKINERYSTKIV